MSGQGPIIICLAQGGFSGLQNKLQHQHLSLFPITQLGDHVSPSTLEEDTRKGDSCSLKGSKMYVSRGSISGLFLAFSKLK